MNYTNEQYADHCQLIAHLFLKVNEPWRSKAFSKVAGELRIRRAPLRFDEFGLYNDNIEGVGDAIKDVLKQFRMTGTSEKLEGLKKRVPPEELERFDAKTAKRKVSQLLKPLTEAGVDWGYAGSMRRGQSTVRDVDVIVVLNDEERERALVEKTLMDAGLSADVRNGTEKVGVSVPIKSHGRAFTLDLNFTVPEQRGAYYLYFTGPKAFNIKQRGAAKRKGWRLNQKGLFDKNGNVIASRTERQIFNALNWKWLEPNERS